MSDESHQQRKEVRDTEIQSRISRLSSAEEFRHQTLRENYTRRTVRMGLGKLGWTLVITQASCIVFFSALFVISYIPKTKFIVTKILP